jgi:hypothetical protein
MVTRRRHLVTGIEFLGAVTPAARHQRGDFDFSAEGELGKIEGVV